MAEIRVVQPMPTKIAPGINLCLISESFLGFIWWSTVFSLPSSIWFFPLNAMSVTGYEALAVVWLSPIILVVPAFNRICCSLTGNLIFRLITVLGMLSLHSSTPISRLLVVAVANACALLWICGSWWDPMEKNRSLTFWGLTNGYVAMLVSRICWTSLNPFWTHPDINMYGFILALVAFFYRMSVMWKDSSVLKPDLVTVARTVSISKWLPVALSFAGWLFLMQLLFADVAVLSRWIVGTYPKPGPMPNPWGLLVLVAVAVGVFISERAVFTHSLRWWALGTIAAAVFYSTNTYFGYCGGLGLCIYLMSVWPCILSKLYRCPKAVTLTIGMLAFILLTLASVWTVAYNFVPGGVYARERQDVVIAVALSAVGLGIFTDTSGATEKEGSSGPNVDGKTGAVSTPEFLDPRSYKFFLHRRFKLVMVLALAISGMAIARRIGEAVNQHRKHRDAGKTFTGAVWAIHMGFDNMGWNSFDRSAELLKNSGASVIGILESDCSRPCLGSTDIVMFLEEHLGMYSDYGPSTKKHTWGAALLSRYPILKSTHHLLPSPAGELAPAIHATLNVTGSLMDVVVVHMGNHWDDLDRKLQAEKLAEIMNESSNPMLFLGYLSSAPGDRDYRVITSKGRMKDIDETDFDRWCEYIFYRGLVRLGYARVSRGMLSDTEIQMGRFRLPTDGEAVEDNNILVTSDESIPKSSLFPKAFGKFHAGEHPEVSIKHFYSMWTPKYFKSA